ncbi:hypothetical protein B0H13DRAFT_1916693 [Mycena leptocephala]|nr:hypothetical protein B0H13DRAFT_1916693 [Mycena leptocephala]
MNTTNPMHELSSTQRYWLNLTTYIPPSLDSTSEIQHPGHFDTVPYPLNDENEPILPQFLERHSISHEFQLPKCFHGMDATLSTNDSASGNDSIAMTCASIPFEDKCPFYVNLSKLLVSREFMDFKHYKLRDDIGTKATDSEQVHAIMRSMSWDGTATHGDTDDDDPPPLIWPTEYSGSPISSTNGSNANLVNATHEITNKKLTTLMKTATTLKHLTDTVTEQLRHQSLQYYAPLGSRERQANWSNLTAHSSVNPDLKHVVGQLCVTAPAHSASEYQAGSITGRSRLKTIRLATHVLYTI